MYKTIVVHIDGAPAWDNRLKAAAGLAVRHDARLVGVAATGRLPASYPGDGLTPGFTLPPIDYGPAREAAEQQLRQFETAAGRLGVASRESRLADTSPDLGLLLQSRYCDLMVVSQATMTSYFPFATGRLASYLAVEGASPVLVIPHQRAYPVVGQSVVIGWNGSKEACHAIHAALPLLVTAARVQLLVFNAGVDPLAHGDEPGADMATVLARHGVKVEVNCLPTMDEPGLALQLYAKQCAADLIVAGAYGHSRLQEWCMGGSTRNLLENMHVPVLLAH